MFKDLKYFFQLSRPLNVLITLLAFLVACFIAADKSYAFLYEPAAAALFYSTAFFITLITASGYWINDVYDFRIDRINKPEKTLINAFLSVKKVLSVYFIMVFFIVVFSIGYFVIYKGKHQVAVINIIAVLLLFSYAGFLKRLSVVGNLAIAFLTSLVILLAGYVFRITDELVYTMVFAFQVTLLREVTKDVEDIKGDLQFHLQTLPIQIGIKATKNVLLVLYAFFIISCNLPVLFVWLAKGEWRSMYWIMSIVLVQLPSIYLVFLLKKSHLPEDFSKQSLYLKLLIITGMGTILFL